VIQFRIAADFKGPSLEELDPLVPSLPDPIEVRWTGSRVDYLILDRWPARHFTLVVPDLDTQERIQCRLCLNHTISPEDLAAAKTALVVQGQQTWRPLTSVLGYDRGTLLLCRVMSSALLDGKATPHRVTSLASECVLSHRDPVDTDVFLRLQAKH